MLLASLLPALAGQVHPEDVALDRVVQRSELIVVVESAQPALVSRTIAVPGGPKVEPYRFNLSQLRIVEVIHDKGGARKKGDVVQAAHGSLGSAFSTHVAYYRDGISKSPIVPTYASPLAKLNPRPAQWVAMLRPCSTGNYEGYCYAVSNATEAVENVEMIKKLIKQ